MTLASSTPASPVPNPDSPASPTPARDSPAASSTPVTTPVPVPSGVVLCADGLARPAWAATHPLLQEYYDTEWGVPVYSERGVFERLSLEAFQSGLSWAIILRKREAFRRAFADFDPEVVATFGESDIERLLADASIVRNVAKITATIANAQATLTLRCWKPDEEGPLPRSSVTAISSDTELMRSIDTKPTPTALPLPFTPEPGLAAFIWHHRPVTTPYPHTHSEVPSTSADSRALAKELKRHGFRFVGPTTAFALMEALGLVDTHLVGSHRRGCSGLWSA